ncbi:MAG: MFS transporter [Actinobacteria bacterium]|nr:MFS transporter [Actinomycetota bacterium]MCB9412468.1 MFS transporter [Actinomycetota bacterium]
MTPQLPVEAPAALPKAKRRWWSLIALCLVTALVWFAASDIAIALPTIAGELGGTMDTLQWAVNGYFLAGALIIVGGRVADIYGRRLLFGIGTALILLGSVVAALASTPQLLIIGRVIQGIGAAAVLPTALAIIAVIFSGKQRDAAIAIWIAVCWGAGAIGPLVGGVIVQGLDWQWIFWINLPIGAVALLLTWWSTPETRDPRAVRSIDVPGVVTLVGGLFVLSWALVLFDTLATFAFAGMMAAAVLLLGGFVAIERRASNPVVNLEVFRMRRFDGAVLANLIANFVFAGVVFFMALYLQVVADYDPLRAGIALLPATIPILLVNPIGTWLGQRYGPAWPTALGMACLAVAAFLLLDLTGGVAELLVPFGLIGVGLGLQITPCAVAAVEDPGPAGEGAVSGVFKAASMVGSSLAVAVGTAVFQSDVRRQLEDVLGTPPTELHGQVLDVLTGGLGLGEIADQIPGDARQVVTDVFDAAVGLAMWPTIVMALVGIAAAIVLLRGGADPSGSTRR